MKCLLCPNEIDETKIIHTDNLQERREHASALEQWKQLIITVANKVVIQGHICPDEAILDSLKLVSTKKKDSSK